MKNKINPLIIILIITIIILISNSQLSSIFTPNIPDKSLDSYINRFYSPTVDKTINSERCTIPNVTIGTTFSWDSAKLPRTTDCMVLNNKYYKINKVSTLSKGNCASIIGPQILINNKSPFQNFLFIKQDNNYIICQNLNGKYQYVRFVPSMTKTCSIKYTIPEVENQGKYYCDSKTGSIYRIPCNSQPKELIETCSLGCEKVKKSLDMSSIDVIKCKGDFKPNVKVCSIDGKTLYTTYSTGDLIKEPCCSCSNGVCSKTGCLIVVNKSNCQLISGSKGQINVFFYNDINTLKHEEWIMSYLPTQVPYNEFTYNFYRETKEYDCRGAVLEKNNDIRIGYESIGSSGWGQPSDGKNHAGNLIFDELHYSQITQHFLLLHELGHIYLHFGHTCDNSIMDWNGGSYDHSKVVYKDYQVQLIRKNLNSSIITYPPSGFGGC